VYKKLVWERGWGGGGKSDEDVYEVIIMDDSLRKLLPDLVILIEIEGVQWLETATCERGFSLRTQILTAQRHIMGDSLLACLMMICSNGPSLHGGCASRHRHQDSEGVVCMCSCVGVCVCVCVCVHTTSICVRENLHLH
jgi:hypothetical protein